MGVKLARRYSRLVDVWDTLQKKQYPGLRAITMTALSSRRAFLSASAFGPYPTRLHGAEHEHLRAAVDKLLPPARQDDVVFRNLDREYRQQAGFHTRSGDRCSGGFTTSRVPAEAGLFVRPPTAAVASSTGCEDDRGG